MLKIQGSVLCLPVSLPAGVRADVPVGYGASNLALLGPSRSDPCPKTDESVIELYAQFLALSGKLCY